MSLSRALRMSIGRLLIGVLLFAQFAVASYACPGLKAMGSMANDSAAQGLPIAVAVMVTVAVADTAATAAPNGMPPGCDQMDPDAANLCAQHCHQGQQSADTAAAPALSLSIPTFLYGLPLEPQHALGSGRSFPAADARLDAALEPPHAILHCVFRI